MFFDDEDDTKTDGGAVDAPVEDTTADEKEGEDIGSSAM
jgi:hypothetical protein